jgi:hypothetical protein
LLLRRLNSIDTFLASSIKEVSNEVSLILCARRAICKCRWRLWPIKEEHIWELWDRKTSRRPNSVFPVASNGVAFGVTDVKLGERARNRVEACCENDDVNVNDTFILGADAVLFDTFNRALVNVDDFDVRLVDYFVEALLEGWPFGAPS